MSVFRTAICILVVAVLIGCGSNDSGLTGPKAKATGKVTMNGQPLNGARVIFMPVGPTSGFGAEGTTSAEGEYRLKAIRGDEFIPVGEYKVAIQRWVLKDGSLPPPGSMPANSGAAESLAPDYSNRDQTTLKATIPEAGGTFNFDLQGQSNQ